MANLVVGGILLLAVGAAAAYMIKAKKSGVKCIGCPSGGCCSGSKGCCPCAESKAENKTK